MLFYSLSHCIRISFPLFNQDVTYYHGSSEMHTENTYIHYIFVLSLQVTEESICVVARPCLSACLDTFFFSLFAFLFLHPTQSFCSLPSSHPLYLRCHLYSLSTVSLQIQVDIPWLSASHGISSCSETRQPPPPRLDDVIQQEDWIPRAGN